MMELTNILLPMKDVKHILPIVLETASDVPVSNQDEREILVVHTN